MTYWRDIRSWHPAMDGSRLRVKLDNGERHLVKWGYSTRLGEYCWRANDGTEIRHGVKVWEPDPVVVQWQPTLHYRMRRMIGPFRRFVSNLRVRLHSLNKGER